MAITEPILWLGLSGRKAYTSSDTPKMSDPKNCALNPDSTLKDASQIRFFNSLSNKHAIGEFGSASDVQPKSGNVVSSDDHDHLPTTVELSRGFKGKVRMCILKWGLDLASAQVQVPLVGCR